MTSRPWNVLLAVIGIALISGTVGCAAAEIDPGGGGDDDDSSSDSDTDNDTDADADADTDSDTDTDTDTDSDTDTDADTDTNPCTDECPDGEGFPCPCPLGTCADDILSICGSLGVTASDVGVCASPCATNADCTTTLSCNASPECVLILEADTDTEPDQYCGYVCDVPGDCPSGMTCEQVAESTLYICYPIQS